MKNFILTLTLIALITTTGCGSRRSGNRSAQERQDSRNAARQDEPRSCPAIPLQETPAPCPPKDLKTVSGTIDMLWIEKGWTYFTLAYPIKKGALASDGWYYCPTFALKSTHVAGAARGDEVSIGYTVDENGAHIVSTLTVTMKWIYHGKE